MVYLYDHGTREGSIFVLKDKEKRYKTKLVRKELLIMKGICLPFSDGFAIFPLIHEY